ncbi:cupin domain-containing protein [Luteibacter yeojuensis]|uniref:Cupin domain-containing protein n=1 Tax=Luteibacter yeojuensis TaxID=345309 RepID=A0A7X5QW17_9GAMM|nr:cupin domain-containing protein [Luteibacter yeojuensis]NID16362.1 cupin domain-containing protein [Luteibacter yeojuensis]
MKTVAVAAVVAFTFAAPCSHAHPAQPRPQPGSHRTDLSRNDLSIPGWEALQVRVDIPPGKFAPDHRHPGEEIIYVIEGTIEYRLEGKPPVRLKAGDVLFVPRGVVHSATNVGTTNAAELGTYVVEKGKPLVEWVK